MNSNIKFLKIILTISIIANIGLVAFVFYLQTSHNQEIIDLKVKVKIQEQNEVIKKVQI